MGWDFKGPCEELAERAGLSADAVDLVIVATSTPDYTFPATATQIQTALGITRGVAFT